MSAKFKVIKIDPEGSGTDYSGHLGMIVTDAKRCCERCTVIFGTVGNTPDFGPFITGELEPLNEDAHKIHNEIMAKLEERRKQDEKPLKQVVQSRNFQKQFAELKGEVYFDAPTFDIKKGDT